MISKAKNVTTEQMVKMEKSMVQLKETAKVDKSENIIVAEPTNGSEIGTESKVSASKSETTSTSQIPKTPVDSLSAAGAMMEEKGEETAAKAINLPSVSMASENCPDVETFKAKELETKIQEPVVVLEDIARVVETGNAKVSDLKRQAELGKVDVEAKEAEDAEPMELGETGVSQAPEPMEFESCVEDKGEKLTDTVAVSDQSSESQPPTSIDDTRPDLSPPKPAPVQPQTEAVPKRSDNNTQSPQTSIKTPETSVKSPSQVQQSTLREPQSTAPRLETKIDTSQVQRQAASSSTEAALEAKLTVEKGEKKTTQKGMLDRSK